MKVRNEKGDGSSGPDQRKDADVREKASAQKKIAELNARLAAIVEYSNDAIIGMDLHGIITSWNRGAGKIYGYTAEEMTGRHISVLAPSGQLDETSRILEQIRKGENVEHFETVRIGKDGRQVSVSLAVSPIKSYEGEVIGSSTIARDITRRKKAEETVRRQAQILNQIHDSVITTDLDGYITGWNKGAERMLAYTPDEALGRHISFIYPKEEREFLQHGIIGPLKKKGELENEVRLMKKSGEKIHVLLMLTLVRDENGTVTGMAGSSVNITERKKAEEEIGLAKKEWELTFDAIPDGVAVIDNQYIIRRANKALAARLGIDRDELAGRSCNEVMCGLDKPLSSCPGRMSIINGREQMEERFIEKMKGHYHVSCTPIFSGDGRVERFVEVCRDISKRKKMEEMLRETAIRDTLTGLFNRRGFLTLAEQQLHVAERNNRNMLLLFLDLNNMKGINDEFGHKEGDQALIDTAAILRKTFRESDIIARMGGDEFAVLLTEPSTRDIEGIILEHVRDNLNSHNEKEGRAYGLSFSMGLASYDPERSCSLGELLMRADAMMYEDKKRHREGITRGQSASPSA